MKRTIQSPKQLNLRLPQVTPEPDTFEDIYNRYVGKVYQKCLSMTRDIEEAQDFTQDIFIKVYHNMGSFQNRSTFATWLYSISHNYCIDKIRIGKRFNTESLSDFVTSRVADQDPSTSVEARLQELETLMSELPAEEILFLRLKHEQGLSIREIATQCKLSESAVKMRLKRTRDKLYVLYTRHEF